MGWTRGGTVIVALVLSLSAVGSKLAVADPTADEAGGFDFVAEHFVRVGRYPGSAEFESELVGSIGLDLGMLYAVGDSVSLGVVLGGQGYTLGDDPLVFHAAPRFRVAMGDERSLDMSLGVGFGKGTAYSFVAGYRYRWFRADFELALLSDEDASNQPVALVGPSLLLDEGKPPLIALGVEAGIAAVAGILFVIVFFNADIH